VLYELQLLHQLQLSQSLAQTAGQFAPGQAHFQSFFFVPSLPVSSNVIKLLILTQRVNINSDFVLLAFFAALRENLLSPSHQDAKNAKELFFQTVYDPCD
jgi:hypothetical protein